MTRRHFLRTTLSSAVGGMCATLLPSSTQSAEQAAIAPNSIPVTWLPRWQAHILGEVHQRYCDKATGEDIGWLMSPFLEGFYWGYLATGELRWLELLVNWTDAWLVRGVKEPDGYIGWPQSASGGAVASDYFTDSLLGEAMGWRPVVLMVAEVQKHPHLRLRFGKKAEAYLKLASATFDKWVARGCWREVKDGGVWVVPTFGIDQQTGKWTAGYARRQTGGFSNPANKQNLIARWLTAMHDATGQVVYADHARKWWQVMRSRMRTRQDGRYFVWNYWDPAGPWDYTETGATRHWVGVHPNGGYYNIDVEGIMTAYQHGWVFVKDDLDRLLGTNRDYMWNQQVNDAKFRRIDGGEPDPRWANSPGTLWTALVPYDATLRRIFLANNDPAGWSGLATTPWFIAREKTTESDSRSDSKH